MRPPLLVVVTTILLVAVAGHAQAPVPVRGVDPAVDYAALARFGPWDDRNYQLTRDDLALLPTDEAERRDPIPAFYRVLVRRAAAREGLGVGEIYPRSALNRFRLLYGGYLVGGKLYRRATAEGDRWRIEQVDGVDFATWQARGPEAIEGEIRVTSPNGAAESAIKVHPSNLNRVVAGTNGPGSGQLMHWSNDGGSTWTQVALPLGGTCCDPTVDWSADGLHAYTATLGGAAGVWFYRSADGGQSWTDLQTLTPGDPRREISTSSSDDKEYLHVDKHPTSPYRDTLYLTWHRSNVLQVARSTDRGNTWQTQSFSGSPTGIGSDIVTDRAGNAYYFWAATGGRTIQMRKSVDGGASWAAATQVAATLASYDFPIPSMETRRAWIYAAADADLSNGPYADSLYVAWTDTTAADTSNASTNHAQIRVAYSRDGGATWHVTIPHETADATTVDRWNQWLAVGPDGTVWVAFYDTRQSLPNRDKVDLYYARSTDGAQTWSTPVRITAATSPNIADGFEFGDYNGLDAVIGRLMAIWTDNRQEGPGSGDSIDAYAFGARILPFADGFESGDRTVWSGGS